MKNAITYYYNLIPSSIHQIGKNYYFKVEEDQYVFLPFNQNKEIEYINELSYSLFQKGIPIHQIIPNIQGILLTKLNDETYVLLRIYVSKNPVSLEEIIQFNSLYFTNDQLKLKKADWYTLWVDKVDYLEYQISNIGKKYPLIISSFSYYIGLAENAIQLVGNTPKENIYLSLGHRRITCEDTDYRFFNPLNLVIDIRVRDICDYFKSCFFSGKDIILMVQKYLYSSNLSQNEACYFMARLLFPTYYFDMYEKIISGEIEEEKLNIIIAKVEEYESFLKYIYQYLKQFYALPDIEWLKKTS